LVVTDLKIDVLRLDLGITPGHEHRLAPVAARALEQLAERLGANWSDTYRAGGTSVIEPLGVHTEPIDWDRTNDDDAARHVADALFERLTAMKRITPRP
jgi:hypothetical protein